MHWISSLSLVPSVKNCFLIIVKATTYFFPNRCIFTVIQVTLYFCNSSWQFFLYFPRFLFLPSSWQSYHNWGPRLHQRQSNSQFYAYFCKSSSYLFTHFYRGRLSSFILSVFRLKSCMYIFPFSRIKTPRPFLASLCLFLIFQAPHILPVLINWV